LAARLTAAFHVQPDAVAVAMLSDGAAAVRIAGLPDAAARHPGAATFSDDASHPCPADHLMTDSAGVPCEVCRIPRVAFHIFHTEYQRINADALQEIVCGSVTQFGFFVVSHSAYTPDVNAAAH
jgi:predicted naringenin-chalcone synthase